MSVASPPPRSPPTPRRDPPAAAPPPGGPPTAEPPEPRRGGIVWRIVLGCRSCSSRAPRRPPCSCSGGAQATRRAEPEQRVSRWRQASSRRAGLGGDPQTMLLVGNDQRTHTTTSRCCPHSQRDAAGADRPEQAVDLDDVDPARARGDDPDARRPGRHTRLNSALTYGGISTAGLDDQAASPDCRSTTSSMIDFNQFKTRGRRHRAACTRPSTGATTTSTRRTASSTRRSTCSPATRRCAGTQALAVRLLPARRHLARARRARPELPARRQEAVRPDAVSTTSTSSSGSSARPSRSTAGCTSDDRRPRTCSGR